MAERVHFFCPSCGRPFQAGPQVLPMRVQCRGCSTIFTAERQDPFHVRRGEPLDRACHRIGRALEEQG